MTLIEIGKKYPTSKNNSGFIELYQKYFHNITGGSLNNNI